MYPEDLKYTKEHEWLAVNGGVGTVGITHYAQSELGDIVYVELPAAGSPVVAGEEFGTVESVKAVSEIFAPVSGEVLEVNTALATSPETINKDPYGDGWLLKLKLADSKELDALMTAAEYRKYIEEEAN
ncbi:MAG: glycine cleavage system protein GcvH [Acidobacteria bacterium]|nr:MAG: glycine cleavage system protein H [Acidobacteria bacterium 13_1_40CM_2_68_10]OLE64725.1 MAG: glycine cleavage system protein H [Acidobacteria bacterium 13_1_20CM_2_68_14]PYT38301.1 MAG: glycine cleavage system protein GcvH [Acidobacteriota bacterium]